MMSENLKVVDEVTEETVDTNEEVVEESKLKAICTKVKDTTKKHWKTGVKAGGLCMIYALRHSSSRDCDDDTVYDVDSSPEIIDEEDISEEKSEETNEE